MSCLRINLLQADAPLVAVVTRLTHQKGTHLIKHAAWRTLERGAQFVLLGSAPDPRVQVRTPIVCVSANVFCAVGAPGLAPCLAGKERLQL